MASAAIARIALLSLGLSVLAEAPAAAGDPSSTTVQPAASPIKNDTGKRVCRMVTPTGSRFSQRVCRTPDEWQKDADAAQEHMRQANDGIRDNGCGLQCPN